MKKELIICALLSGVASAAMTDWRNTQTMGVGAHDIRAAKSDCESSGRECAMIWEFVEVEADY